MKLENRVAIVTGGANGIGRAIGLALAKEGADVVVADIETEAADEVVKEIKTLGRKAIAMKVDVANVEETKQMAQAALKEFGKIDVMVNNAGVARGGLFHESTEEAWDYVLGVNLGGVRNCTRAVINHMIERRSGKIVNISSCAGMVGERGATSYSAAKGGIIAFTMALAKEVTSYGINVNCVSPGPIHTRLTAQSPRSEEMMKSTGFGRRGKPEDIAAMVVFLVSDEAAFIVGQNYAVCGLRNLGI
jgi:NAD(P)-dependent dehydrogenase (short-subunit alcohol dehydrogenase family)